jgi:DNA-binding response OmpR family regulator
MITAADLAYTAAALQHGALGYIPKPFDLRYVSHFIAAALSVCAPALTTNLTLEPAH